MSSNLYIFVMWFREPSSFKLLNIAHSMMHPLSKILQVLQRHILNTKTILFWTYLPCTVIVSKKADFTFQNNRFWTGSEIVKSTALWCRYWTSQRT